MTITNEAGFAEHASIQAIDAYLQRAKANRARWDRQVRWLTELRETRAAQIEAGAWPPREEQR